jgi:hypothetical protein
MKKIKHLPKALLIFVIWTSVAVATVTIVTPADTAPTSVDPYVWGEANVRLNATVAITDTQPRSGNGSLMFYTNTITPGQDKADFEIFWDPTLHPTRTLSNVTKLQFDWYRDANSTTTDHFAPALRLYYQTPLSETGLLIWEPVYNGYAAVPTNTWVTSDILTDNFWMRAFDPGRTIDDYNVNLAEWMANTDEEGSPIDDDADSDQPHVLGPDTYIVGINVGVGSGWGDSFLGYVDNVEIEFNGDDSVSANFEMGGQSIYLPIIYKN